MHACDVYRMHIAYVLSAPRTSSNSRELAVGRWCIAFVNSVVQIGVDDFDARVRHAKIPYYMVENARAMCMHAQVTLCIHMHRAHECSCSNKCSYNSSSYSLSTILCKNEN